RPRCGRAARQSTAPWRNWPRSAGRRARTRRVRTTGPGPRPTAFVTPSSAGQDVDTTGIGLELGDVAAQRQREADAGAVHLPGPGFAPELGHDLEQLRRSGRPRRVTPGQQPARRIHDRSGATEPEPPPLEVEAAGAVVG